MAFAADEVAELLDLFGRVQQAEDGGFTYFLLPDVSLPAGCTPAALDALLCPMARDGYSSRLFLSQQIVHRGPGTNWNAVNVRILERNWFAVSWQVRPTLRLAQLVRGHLDAFREKPSG
jgi:hypothetical protein